MIPFFAGYVIAIAALAIIIEIVMIALRFINIGLINLKIKIFLIIVSPAHQLCEHCQVLAFYIHVMDVCFKRPSTG